MTCNLLSARKMKASIAASVLCSMLIASWVSGCSSGTESTSSNATGSKSDDPLTATDTTPDEQPGDSNGDSTLDMLTPDVTAGSDLDRLINGIAGQVAKTLLDLNQRVSGGVELTNQQNLCLGTFDPALGEQLLALDCEQPLATGTADVYLQKAAFYDTTACNASLFAGSANDCVLQRARLSIHTQWVVHPPADDSQSEAHQRPQPIAGSEIYYAIDNTLLRIDNPPDPITGVFRCDVELESTGIITGVTAGPPSCTQIIKAAADRLDVQATE